MPSGEQLQAVDVDTAPRAAPPRRAGSTGCNRRCSPSTATRPPCRSAPARGRRAWRAGGGASAPRSARAAPASGASSPAAGRGRRALGRRARPGRVRERVDPADPGLPRPRASVRSNAASSSVGKPTITSVVTLRCGTAARTASTWRGTRPRCSGGPSRAAPRRRRTASGCAGAGRPSARRPAPATQRVLDVDDLDARQPHPLHAGHPGHLHHQLAELEPALGIAVVADADPGHAPSPAGPAAPAGGPRRAPRRPGASGRRRAPWG